MYRENRFLKLEKETKNTPMSTLYTNEGSIKIVKYEFIEPLQREENGSSGFSIKFCMQSWVV